MIELAEGSTRSLSTITRAVRSGAMPRKILRRLNEIRASRHLPEIVVADPLEEARDRAGRALASMKAALAAVQ